LHDRATNHHLYLLPRADVVRQTWLEPQSRSSPATPFWTVAKHTTTLPPFSVLFVHVLTYVAEDTRLVAPIPPSTPFLYPPLRGSHDGGRNMQIREINARKFHYNSTRKISSSSCDPHPRLPPSLSLPPLVTTSVSLASTPTKSGAPSSFLPSFQNIQEHPHYLVFPRSTRKMAGKTVNRLDQDGFYIPAKSAYFLIINCFCCSLIRRITFKLQCKPISSAPNFIYIYMSAKVAITRFAIF